VMLASMLMLVQLLASLYYFIVVMGLPSAVDEMMFLFSLLLLASLHAVVGFTVFASIPAFGGVLLAVLLFHSFLLLLAFLLL
jgi:hypothetical protein